MGINRAKMAAFLTDESGATAIEYALIASIVSMCIVVALTQISGTLKTTFNSVGSALQANGE